MFGIIDKTKECLVLQTIIHKFQDDNKCSAQDMYYILNRILEDNYSSWDTWFCVICEAECNPDDARWYREGHDEEQICEECYIEWLADKMLK